jgi:hypothetical protein
MRNWLPTLSFVATGLALGFGIGYATSSLNIIFDSPLVTAHASGRSDSFTKVLTGIGNLDAVESVVGRCGSTEDFQRKSLAAEDLAIGTIQEATVGSTLDPPLDVARARLATRWAILGEKRNDIALIARSEGTTRRLLQTAGWRDPSVKHMREILARWDAEVGVCTSAEIKGKQSR